MLKKSMNNDKKSYKAKLKDILRKYIKTDYRINHSLSTAKLMKKYAKEFGLNKKKAYIAGLLHDLAKELSIDEILKLSENFIKRQIIDIYHYDFKKNHGFLLHGVASAELLVRELNIMNKEILEAVCCHTYGGKSISKLSQFTFMADFCEPYRNYIPSKKVYKELIKNKNFYKAYYMSYLFLVKRLVKKRKTIILDTIEGYNEALILLKNSLSDGSFSDKV